jgi:hypothetical protein
VSNSKALSGFIGLAGDAIIVIPVFAFYMTSYAVLSATGTLSQKLFGDKLGNKLHSIISNYTGYDFTCEKISKKWVPREVGDLAEKTSGNSEFTLEKSNLPSTEIEFLFINPAFTSYYKNLTNLDSEKFSESFTDKCEKNSRVKALIDSNNNLKNYLKDYAKSFCEASNKLISENSGKINSLEFGNITKFMYEEASKVKSPIFLSAAKEIKKLIKETFDESQGINNENHIDNHHFVD